ncbi:MAG: hypothetical protein WAX69_04415, partial [Victivallales bacterium]
MELIYSFWTTIDPHFAGSALLSVYFSVLFPKHFPVVKIDLELPSLPEFLRIIPTGPSMEDWLVPGCFHKHCLFIQLLLGRQYGIPYFFRMRMGSM